MNVTLEKLDDVTAILNVNIEESDYKDKVNSDLKEIGRTHKIPGFRPGHVPVDQLRRRFGRQVKSEVLNHDAAEAAFKYIEDNKLEILGQPLPVEVKEIKMDDKDYTFQFEIGLLPNINITLDKSEHLPFYTIKVSDDMLKEQDTQLRERFGAQVPGEEVDAKALVKGAIMELNEDGTVKEGDDAIQVVDGIVGPMYFKSKEQADLFMGKKLGDKVVFNPWKTCDGHIPELASMLHVDKDRVTDLHNDFQMVISEIIVLKLAEHGQEFYDEVFGKDKVTDEKAYNEALKQMIAQSLAPNSETLFRLDAQNYFTKQAGDFEIPKGFLKKLMLARNPELTAEKLDAEFDSMIPALRWQMIRDHIARTHDMQITEADLLAIGKQIAAQQFAQYGMTNVDEDTITNFAKNIVADKNYRQRLIEQVSDQKLFNIIKASVTLDLKEVSLDDFKKLVEEAAPGKEA